MRQTRPASGSASLSRCPGLPAEPRGEKEGMGDGSRVDSHALLSAALPRVFVVLLQGHVLRGSAAGG